MLLFTAHRGNKLVVKAAKELHFNRNMEALKRMQAGVDKLASVVGVTIGPKASSLACITEAQGGCQGS